MSKQAAHKEGLINRLHPSKSLGVRLFLVFFITTMGIVLSLGYISYSVARHTIESNALSSNEQTVQQTAEKLDVVLLRFEDRLEQLLHNKDVQHAVDIGTSPGDGSVERRNHSVRIAEELEHWLGTADGVQAVYLAPVNAALPVSVSGTPDSAFMEGIREASWYRQLQEQPQSHWITQSLKDGETAGIFHLAKSVADGSGNTNYIAICDIESSALEAELGKVNLGPGSYIQLLTSNDEMIASSQDEQTDTYLRLGGTLFKGVSQVSGSLPTMNEQGESILAVYGTLASSGWRLLGVVPAANLTQDAGRILDTTYIAVAAAAGVAVLIGLWMVRMVSKPLLRLKNLMFQGAEGDLRVRTDKGRRDEIGQLSGSFNIMMERIRELVVHTNDTARDVLEAADALSGVSLKTAAAAKDIASATEEIAGGAGGLALEADRGNEMTALIAGRMNAVFTAAKEMGSSAHTVDQSSQEGVAKLRALLDRTQTTGEMTEHLVLKVNELKETASTVNDVLGVMQGIAQQTNILSLNASIEAARAGEAGKGFKVVADEIRQLAGQSRRSIAMVAEITGRIMGDMHETEAALSDVTPLFGEQTAAVRDTSEIFTAVQEEMSQFILRLDSVEQSIGGLNQSQSVLSQTIGNVSAFAEESSAASEEVASLSSEQQNVSDYLVELSGRLEKASLLLKERLSKFSV
ncbi:methyl-accepting chemotaxis protein [Paenibacillus sp. PK3_47]|uniref:methyl-accepting chemotaxis protein n=1 Tax=Paenibacillus sp. PK3_47 TaxID=2072642 RepID=UPI00201DD472|nr:methyl-accepting chemotaxis protein [Paenibacillus sp. PK3_47]UQZ35694.1 methyl-accepting chemotaxis protein [Paenibacillus sp. PK3_47]